MAKASFSISTRGVAEYRALAKKLRGSAGKELRQELRKQIAEAGKPVVDEVKEAVLRIPVTSHGGGTAQRRKFNVSRAKTQKSVKRAERSGAGLRQTIAGATRLQITAKGVRIIVNSGRLPESQQSLPRHLDSEKGWRHPVFGNRSNWVQQRGRPYFANTIKQRAPKFRQAVLDAMQKIADKLESGS